MTRREGQLHNLAGSKTNIGDTYSDTALTVSIKSWVYFFRQLRDCDRVHWIVASECSVSMLKDFLIGFIFLDL